MRVLYVDIPSALYPYLRLMHSPNVLFSVAFAELCSLYVVCAHHSVRQLHHVDNKRGLAGLMPAAC